MCEIERWKGKKKEIDRRERDRHTVIKKRDLKKRQMDRVERCLDKYHSKVYRYINR